jgi:3-oxoacyl-[acyl-carrier-protein] synthase II
MSRRVVVTGLGVVSPLGNTVKGNWNSLIEGKGGIGPITSFPCHCFPTKIAGEIKNFKPTNYQIKPKALKIMTRAIQYAIASTYLALEDAKIAEKDYEPRQVGLTLGVDGIQYTAEEFLLSCYEAVGKDLKNYISADDMGSGVPIKTRDPDLSVNPLWPLSVLSNMGLCHISIQHNFQGPNLAFSSIDAGGAQAVGEAFKSIRQGAGNIYFAGGTYALNTMHLLSLSSSNLLSEKNGSCRPFDRSRDGCVLGEGSAMLVLEEISHAKKRGASIYAEIVGFSSFFNGHANLSNVGSDPPDWEGMYLCMIQALNDASISPSDIDYINADGKGTVFGDRAEALAIKHAFGEQGSKVPVSTSKPLTGHLLPASGAFEAASTVLSVKEDLIPPTENCTDRDAQCNLNVISENALKKEINYAISNTFGFTGEHTTLVFGKYKQ